MTSTSIDFNSNNDYNPKSAVSYANFNAFSGLSIINDESTRIREKRKREKECLLNNSNNINEKVNIKKNVKDQIVQNELFDSHHRNDAVYDREKKDIYQVKKVLDEHKRNLEKQLSDKKMLTELHKE